MPLAAIDRMRFAPDDESPQARTDLRVIEREAATDFVRELIADDPEAAGTFEVGLRCAHLYNAGRERTKTNNVKIVHEMRLALRELGRRAVERGDLRSIEQIFMLVDNELDDFVERRVDFRELVAEREHYYLSLYDVEPPFVTHGPPPPVSQWRHRAAASGADHAVAGDVLMGIPGCPGVARGRARVVMDPTDPRARARRRARRAPHRPVVDAAVRAGVCRGGRCRRADHARSDREPRARPAVRRVGYRRDSEDRGRSDDRGGRQGGNGDDPLMLDHLRVVEVSVWVAGPAAGGVLADWGADVIKVEPPEGDPMRRLFGAIGVQQTKVPPFELDNRGKRSVVLDLRSDDGIAAMWKLLETADVFLTNLRADALERLGLDPATVRERLPRIVYASVTGYGLTGPERGRPGYDIGAFWARSGAAATFVPSSEDPPTIRSGYGDHTTGLTVLAGLLGALLERERTGEGRLVEVSLLGTGIYCMGWDLSILSGFGKISSTKPRALAPAPLVNCYKAGDERWFWLLGLEGDRHWPGLVRAIDRVDLNEDERFATAVGRREHGAALVAELDETFAARTYEEWIERFDAHDVWWAPVQTLREVLADPQANAAGMFVEMAGIDGERYRSVATPVRFEPSTDHVAQPGLVPTLGQHTAEVLAELGL